MVAAFRNPVALVLAAALLASCNSTTPTSRAAPAAGSSNPASLRVNDASQPVQLSSAGVFSLTLPAGALAGLIGQLGPVDVTARAGDVGSLPTADQVAAQAAVRSGLTEGATVLRALQLDVSAASSGATGTSGLRTRQAAATAMLTFSLQLPAGTSCPSNSFVVQQVVSGKAVLSPGLARTDQATKQQLSGEATATMGGPHLAFLFLCMPPLPAGADAKPLGLAKPVHLTATPKPSAAPGYAVAPITFADVEAPFTRIVPGAVLTISDDEFSGYIGDSEDVFFEDETLGLTITDYAFEISETPTATGGQSQAGYAQVTIAGGTHDVSFDEELYPVMSDNENILIVSDDTSGVITTLIADTEMQNFALLAGQFSAQALKRLRTKDFEGFEGDVIDISVNPDGTWLVDEEGAATSQAAAQLILQSQAGESASLHGLAGLLGLLSNQPQAATLTPTCCTNCGGNGPGDSYKAPEDHVVTARGQLTVQALPAPLARVVELLRAVIQLKQQAPAA